MIDQAGIMMAQGALIASERIIGVNDNMAQSHYHEYFELYYLETGERFHMVQDRCYKMTAGEFIIFPPYVMHYSYGEKDMPFKKAGVVFSDRRNWDQMRYSESFAENGEFAVWIQRSVHKFTGLWSSYWRSRRIRDVLR